MRNPAVFIDRDGVINRMIFKNGKPRAPDLVADFEFFPGVVEAIAGLRAAGFKTIVVTNQPDVARGWQIRENVDAMNEVVREKLGVDAIKVCFHDNADGCECRKPRPGMILEATHEFEIDLDRSYMIGDRRIDVEAGRSANCRASLLVDIDGTDSENVAAFRPDAVVRSLLEGAEWILRDALTVSR